MRSLSGNDALDRLQSALSARYRVQRELGRGATARVFLATDLKHDRQVAIKLLNPDLIGQLGAERFLREIRVTASLQHPHILPLYDSGEAEGLLYYVTSYVEGESLRTRLQRNRVLPVDEAVAMTRTLAMALDFAHRHGVIHRDIKPENILLQDGQPVLADFGIALALSKATDERVTGTGLSLGTPQYMSPEQASGARDVGPRSDIYSLGAVAYELLVGEPPVTGPTREAILSRIIVEPPRPIGPVRPTVPHALEAAILKALAKDPVDRFATAASFAAAIDSEAPAPVVGVPSVARRRVSARVVALAIGTAGLVAAAVLLTRLPPRPPAAVFRQLTFSGDVRKVAISPDGRRIVYAALGPVAADWEGGDRLATARQHVIVQDVAGGAPDTLISLPSIITLEWSHDGSKILVAGRKRAMVLSDRGSANRNIEAAEAFPAYVLAHWLPDGSRVSLHKFADKHLLLLRLDDEAIDTIPFPGDYTWLEEGSWSPDGRRFAAATRSDDIGNWALRMVDLSGRSQILLEDTVLLVGPRWSQGGDALYYLRNGQELFRLPISTRGDGAAGTPQELHSRLDAMPGNTAFPIAHSVARNAPRVVYVKGQRISNLWMLEPDDEGRIGRSQRLTSGTAMRWSPSISPDGEWILFAERSQGNAELFRMPIAGGRAIQITTDAKVVPNGRVAWSPAGDKVAFTSDRTGIHQIWVADVNTGRLRVFENTRASGSTFNLTWAPGAAIAYQRPGNRAIDLLDPESGSVRTLVSDSTGFFHSPVYSSNGAELALTWNREGFAETLWLFGVADSSRRQVQDPAVTPRDLLGAFAIGWEGDNLFANGGGKVYRIAVQSAAEARLALDRPFTNFDCVSARTLQPRFICASFESMADVWMIDRFDPHSR